MYIATNWNVIMVFAALVEVALFELADWLDINGHEYLGIASYVAMIIVFFGIFFLFAANVINWYDRQDASLTLFLSVVGWACLAHLLKTEISTG